MVKFNELEKKIGYEFKNKELLKEALAHKSSKLGYNNERLEFLGDAVMDLIIGEYLYRKYNKNNEGELSKLRAALVNEQSFANLANELNLGKFIFVSQAEENNQGRKKISILSDAFEALMGAIYLESGLEVARELSINLLENKYKNIDLNSLKKDHKTNLQEITQAKFGTTPTYKLILSSGPDHNKTFVMAVFLNETELAQGKGKSKKEAEQMAANLALEKLKD